MSTSDFAPKRKSEKVRALSRGLKILRYVNAAGSASPGEIAKAVDIPRPSVYRLLETLEEEEYVAFAATSNKVRVTRLAASLGDGFTVTSRLCQVAGPILAEYVPQLVWPLDISVYENAAMVIQETTHGRSPMSIDRGMIGYRLPMLRTSAGRCYLGSCSAQERDMILDHIRHMADPNDAPFLDPHYLKPMLDGVSEGAIATRNSGEFRHQTSSMAVAVYSGREIAGCVSLIWIKSAMDLAEALDKFEAPLHELAIRIAKAME